MNSFDEAGLTKAAKPSKKVSYSGEFGDPFGETVEDDPGKALKKAVQDFEKSVTEFEESVATLEKAVDRLERRRQ